MSSSTRDCAIRASLSIEAGDGGGSFDEGRSGGGEGGTEGFLKNDARLVWPVSRDLPFLLEEDDDKGLLSFGRFKAG